MPANIACMMQGAMHSPKCMLLPCLRCYSWFHGKTAKPRLPNPKSATVVAIQPCDLKTENRARSSY